MHIIRSNLEDPTINPLYTLEVFILMIKADCDKLGIKLSDIYLRFNVNTLSQILHHPCAYHLNREEFEAFLGCDYKIYKDSYVDTVCVYHNGIILDTIIFYGDY